MRNPPERYLQTLQEHFTRAPVWFADPAASTSRESAVGSSIAPVTTNQDGKGTAFQRWFHFKEAFSPSFVSAAIASLKYRPKHIADPFGGSGTSAITAQLLSIDATTVEVNPFLLGGLPAGLVLMVTPRRQRIGDLVAGTYVLLKKDVTPATSSPENQALVFD